MKTTKLFLIIASISLFVSSCRKEGVWGIRGRGNNITEIKNLNGFDGIRLKISADVTYTQDSIYYVELSAQEDILAVLETKVENNDLVIDTRRELWSHSTIRVTIHAPLIERVNVEGSGLVALNSPVETASAMLNIDGSGNIIAASLKVQNFSSSIDGSGNITVNGGTSTSSNVSIKGSGNIDLLEMFTNTSTVNISGSGNASVNVSDQLTVNISGSGNAYYRGSPSVSKNISGSGNISHLN